MAYMELPEALTGDLEIAGVNGPPHYKAETAPDDSGAYVLLLGLRKKRTVARPIRNARILGPGWYLYAGSARGRGGIAARLAHHFRGRKGGHWHIDQLTPHAAARAAFAVPGGDECDLICTLLASFAFDVAVTRFGASDCPVCPSHLLIWRAPEDRPVSNPHPRPAFTNIRQI